MSEKRFTIHKESKYKEEWYDYPFCIKEDGRVVLETIPLYIAEKVRDKLNEQQATINELKEENKKLIEEWEFSFRTEMAHHRFAEKELQEKIREKQATISDLKDENEQLKEERNYFERKKCEYFNKYNKKHLDNIQLKEGNEQLKKRLEHYAKVEAMNGDGKNE